MKRLGRAATLLVVFFLLTSCGRDTRVLKPGTEATGCEFRGMAQDDNMEDILKKAGKMSGDTVVMREPVPGKDFVVEVYRCGPRRGTK